MVDGGHVFAERGGGEIAEQWEKRLKSAEPEGGFERVEARSFLTVRPLPMETANVSIDTETAISNV